MRKLGRLLSHVPSVSDGRERAFDDLIDEDLGVAATEDTFQREHKSEGTDEVEDKPGEEEK